MDWKKPSRFLLTASVALGLVLSLGCEKNSPFVDHALNRLGYGPDPWTQARLIELGPFQYIEEQLDPDSIDDRPVETVLTSYPSLQMACRISGSTTGIRMVCSGVPLTPVFN